MEEIGTDSNSKLVLPTVEQLEAGKQVKYFVVKRFFYTNPLREEIVEQWWLYGLENGVYEPIVGTYEQDIEKVRKIFIEELKKV